MARTVWVPQPQHALSPRGHQEGRPCRARRGPAASQSHSCPDGQELQGHGGSSNGDKGTPQPPHWCPEFPTKQQPKQPLGHALPGIFRSTNGPHILVCFLKMQLTPSCRKDWPSFRDFGTPQTQPANFSTEPSAGKTALCARPRFAHRTSSFVRASSSVAASSPPNLVRLATLTRSTGTKSACLSSSLSLATTWPSYKGYILIFLSFFFFPSSSFSIGPIAE